MECSNRTHAVLTASAFQIFDFVNVQQVHNATFLQALPPTFGAQAYAFANFHENGVFTDAAPGGIGNSASPSPSPLTHPNLCALTL